MNLKCKISWALKQSRSSNRFNIAVVLAGLCLISCFDPNSSIAFAAENSSASDGNEETWLLSISSCANVLLQRLLSGHRRDDSEKTLVTFGVWWNFTTRVCRESCSPSPFASNMDGENNAMRWRLAGNRLWWSVLCYISVRELTPKRSSKCRFWRFLAPCRRSAVLMMMLLLLMPRFWRLQRADHLSIKTWKDLYLIGVFWSTWKNCETL